MAHILLVDDDEDLIEINKMVLARRGHTVTVAYSAEEARQRAQANPPDAAVLDIVMEDIAVGFDLARHLHEQYPQLQIIVLTGIRREMRPGFDLEPMERGLAGVKFLEKPVKPRVLVDEVEKLLAAKQAV
ncbi:MAG: response regulator [Acidobacteriia bacterium]|nr:response regulator [Terriglobia bacterium]